MLQHKEKYLYAPYIRGGGLDSKILDLEIISNTALSIGRIPILNEEKSSSSHRLDNKKRGSTIDWEKYIDLSASQILKVGDGTTEEIPWALQYVHQRDFDFGAYSEGQIRYIDSTQLHDEVNDEYPIICLLNSKDLKVLSQRPKIGELCYKGRIKFDRNINFFIILRPSQEVNDITDIVLNHFGTTREGVQKLSNALYTLDRYATSVHKKLCSSAAGCYICMHVRYGRDSRSAQELLQTSNALRKSVSQVVKEVYRRFDRSLPLYIMSNITQSDYFDFLKLKYDVYRYTDFKELRERFVDRKEIDHNLLYSVEKNIMKHAPIKIFSGNRGRFIYRGPWYKTSTGSLNKKQRNKNNSNTGIMPGIFRKLFKK